MFKTRITRQIKEIKTLIEGETKQLSEDRGLNAVPDTWWRGLNTEQRYVLQQDINYARKQYKKIAKDFDKIIKKISTLPY